MFAFLLCLPTGYKIPSSSAATDQLKNILIAWLKISQVPNGMSCKDDREQDGVPFQEGTSEGAARFVLWEPHERETANVSAVSFASIS